jgi:hypothetical protein
MFIDLEKIRIFMNKSKEIGKWKRTLGNQFIAFSYLSFFLCFAASLELEPF